MRFMMLMKPHIPNEADWTPNPEAVAAMTKYNDQLRQAGVLLALDGLAPSSQGARVSFAGGQPTVADGPFADTQELVGGYWMIEVHRARMRSSGPRAVPPPTARRSKSARSSRCPTIRPRCRRPPADVAEGPAPSSAGAGRLA